MQSTYYSPPTDGSYRTSGEPGSSSLVHCWNSRFSIEQLLSQGTVVLCDRYAFSGVAFSASKEGMSYEWCRAPEKGLPAPDITLFLDISPENARSRGGYGQERYETEVMQRRVRTMFDRIGEEMNADGTKRWINIDAGRERDAVTQMLWTRVEPVINGVDRPIDRLWTQT
jgi:dTMP kinase